MDAENVIELPVDYPTVKKAYDQVKDVLADQTFEGEKVSPKSGIGLYSVCPGWNGDLRWISSSNAKGFAFFDKYFDELDVVEKTQSLLGDHGDLIMYSGFFVVRSVTAEPYYHLDYSSAVGFNAFTLMTPVTENSATGNLLYHDAYGEEQVYKYSNGTAVCFGGDFYHSTEPFRSDEQRVFLCFTYGVTDMTLWDEIAQTVAKQGLLYRHPVNGIVRTS